MNLFYKIHLQAFSVIIIVLYHSGPTFGQVLYSCQNAFVFDASDYSGHLIRHLLNASEAFHTEWFLQFWEQVKVWCTHVRTVRQVGKHLPSILFQNFRYCTWGMRPRVIVQNEDTGCEHGGPFFGESLDAKHLAETFCSCRCYSGPRRHSVCCCHSILVVSHNHHELNFRLLPATFFSGEEKLHAYTESTEILVVVQNLVSMFHRW